MRKKKLINLTRQQEAERQNQVYQEYNKQAENIVNTGRSLTQFKAELATQHGYKNYQTVANLISRKDKLRRVQFIDFLRALSDELVVPVTAHADGRTETHVCISNDQFRVHLRVVICYDCIEEEDADIPEYGITEREIKLLSVLNNGEKSYLNRWDANDVTNFFKRKLIFDIVPE